MRRGSPLLLRGGISLLVPLVIAASAPVARAALPSDSPDDTYQAWGKRVRSVVVAGDNVWIGGIVDEVQTGKNVKVRSVVNLAALDRSTGGPSSAAPLQLGGVSGAQVWKLAVAGTTVYAAGKFSLSAAGKTYANLVAFDGQTGELLSSFRPTGVPPRQSVLVQGGVVYAGGATLVAVDATTGSPVPGFTPSSLKVDASLRGHKISAAHRELLMLGGWLYSACQCDSLTQNGQSRGVKALIRFDPQSGVHDPSFVAQGAGATSFGISVTTDGADLYLGAGGSDFVARYAPGTGYGGGLVGAQVWKRDTSGSAQAVKVTGGDLVVGGHFVEIADETGDNCGFRSSTDPSKLDPNDECQSRERLASYTLGGILQGWNPIVTGNYNGVWSIELDGSRMHVGGEFRKVHGVRQTYYVRLS
jgi:hypothetical protein